MNVHRFVSRLVLVGLIVSSNSQKSIVCVAALITALSLVAPAQADWILDFESPLPSTVTGRNTTLGAGPPSPTYLAPSVDSGVLTLSDPMAAGDGGATVGALWHEEVFTDVRVSSTINPTANTNDWLGLTARADETNSNGYFLMFGYSSGELLGGKLIDDSIASFNLSSTDPTQGAQAPLTDLARPHFLQLAVIANEFTGRLLDEAGGTELLSVRFTDIGQGDVPAFVSGNSGLFDFIEFVPPDFPDNVHGTFDDVTSAAIPEPGGLVLCCIGAGLFARCLRLHGRSRAHSCSCSGCCGVT